MSSYPHLLYYWGVPPPSQPTYGKLFHYLFLFMIICKNLFFLWESFWISFYLWSSMRILLKLFLFMIVCEKFFESFLIYDHLWESFPFMRIFLNFFLFMIICENLFLLSEFFESLLMYDHLWESLLFCCNLFPLA